MTMPVPKDVSPLNVMLNLPTALKGHTDGVWTLDSWDFRFWPGFSGFDASRSKVGVSSARAKRESLEGWIDGGLD